jgi:dihydropteroate synthase
MAVRPAGVLRLGRRAFEPSQLVIMTVVATGGCRDPAVAMERVRAVVDEGADAVEVLSGLSGEVPGGLDAEVPDGLDGEVPSGPDGEVPGGLDGEVEEIRRVVSFVAGVRDAYPELVVGVRTARREVAREACAAGADLLSWGGPGRLGPLGSWGFELAEVAAEFGAGVVCPPTLAGRAVEAGVEPERVVVGGDGFAGLAELVATGWPVLVSLSDQDGAGGVAGGAGGSAARGVPEGVAGGLAEGVAGGLAEGVAGGLAAAAVGAWLGARVFRVPWIGQTRRVLRMVSAIRGDSPPARAVRAGLIADERGGMVMKLRFHCALGQ